MSPLNARYVFRAPGVSSGTARPRLRAGCLPRRGASAGGTRAAGWRGHPVTIDPGKPNGLPPGVKVVRSAGRHIDPEARPASPHRQIDVTGCPRQACNVFRTSQSCLPGQRGLSCHTCAIYEGQPCLPPLAAPLHAAGATRTDLPVAGGLL